MIFPRIFIKCHMQTNKYLCNHLSTIRKTLMAKSTCCAWNNTKHMSYLYRHFFFISNILVKLLGNLLVMNCNVRRHCIQLLKNVSRTYLKYCSITKHWKIQKFNIYYHYKTNSLLCVFGR